MFKRICVSLVVVLGLGLSSITIAQQRWCWEWSAECAPVMNSLPNSNSNIDNSGSTGAGNNSNYSGSTRPTKTVIVNKFGAVALNNDASAFGYSANQLSKTSAAQEAIASCAQSGCKIVATYANQCAAFAWGKTARAGITRFAGGSTKEIAETKVLNACNQKAKNCQILMSECSIYGK